MPVFQRYKAHATALALIGSVAVMAAGCSSSSSGQSATDASSDAHVTISVNCEPIVATGTICTCATFGAAVAIVSDCPVPTSTVQTCRRSALGCFSTFVSLPTTTPEIGLRRSIASTGKPNIASRSTI